MFFWKKSKIDEQEEMLRKEKEERQRTEICPTEKNIKVFSS